MKLKKEHKEGAGRISSIRHTKLKYRTIMGINNLIKLILKSR